MSIKMNILQHFLILATAVCYCIGDSHESKLVSVTWNAVKDKYKLVHDEIAPDWVAWATFSDQTNENGWSFLKVVTNENVPDKVQSYAAGMAEGHLTSRQMQYAWDSSVDSMCSPETGSNEELCDQVWQFLRINKEWMNSNIEKYAGIDPYWHQIELILLQMDGIKKGCKDKSFITHSHNILFEEFGFWLFTISPDITEGLLAKINYTFEQVNDHSGSCSVLIKPLSNNTDLYVSHDTWTWYTSMVRIIKNYEFHYHIDDQPGSPVVPGFNITFSSYPGSVQSIDDYYLISSGLTTLETTLEIYNDSLLQFIQPDSVMEAFRVMSANRLAENGENWTNIFIKFNSGTYNNQWMIVNYNLFQPGNANLSDGLLWIIEQIPGYYEAADVTSVLRNQGYWASYNIPYFERIFNLSGSQTCLEQYGPIFCSYNDYFRALIFKREQVKVVDMDSMIKVMRYNNYENDPYSICPNCTPKHNAMMSIAARGDLNPADGTYSPSSCKSYAFGAIDMKTTNFSMFKTLQFIAIGGPTHETLPPFRWRTYEEAIGEMVKHDGQPDLWDFEPVLTVWN
ncbi:Putative phospholipase B-like 2 [Chamberlinius hualienensis]